MAAAPSSRPVADSMNALREAFQKQRAGRYTVVRGAVSWASWDFAAKPYAVSINIDVRGLVDHTGMREITLGIELATTITKSQEGLDDLALDDIADDIERALAAWKLSRTPDGSQNVFRINKETTVLKEFHDANKGLQGIVATVDCTV